MDTGPTGTALATGAARSQPQPEDERPTMAYQLTISHGASATISIHANREKAYAALLRYVVGADYYLAQRHTGPQHTSYDLICLAEPDDSGQRGANARKTLPRRAGHAAIEAIARWTRHP